MEDIPLLSHVRGQLLLAHQSSCGGITAIFAAQRDTDNLDLCAADAAQAASALESAAARLRRVAAAIETAEQGNRGSEDDAA